VGAGNLIHATYSLIGIGLVISKSILMFNLLKWVGAAYLIYIGVKSLKAKRIAVAEDQAIQQRHLNPWTAFRIGFLGNLLNPKATLFFLALFTQIIEPATPMAAKAVYGTTVAVIAMIWFALVATVISQQAFKRRILSIAHWLERFMGAALIALGLRLATAEAD
jgi:threonine/homoserine/homoserine lactone efflux protein